MTRQHSLGILPSQPPTWNLAPREKIFAVATFALACSLLLMLLIWVLNPHVDVTIFNESGTALSDVSINYGGGKRTAERIIAGSSATASIRSSGESGITLSYRDSDGGVKSTKSLAYIEAGYRGSLEIHVEPGSIRILDRVYPDAAPPPWAVPAARNCPMRCRQPP
jgi:hypothetical protein